MVEWLLDHGPGRIVDAGCGSGRFAVEVARDAAEVEIIAVDIDPVATLMTRAALATLGARRVRVLQADYTAMHLEDYEGRTAFVGNPPYVRHHGLDAYKKAWAAHAGGMVGHRVSGLSGLHVYFYLATALHAKRGDVGSFVTSAEWLDIGYGAALRDMLLNGLGVDAIHVVDARAAPFQDAQATAVITCFEVGKPAQAVRFRRVRSPEEIRSLDLGRLVPRADLASAERWSALAKAEGLQDRRGLVSLGSLVRVHRGLVTGGNKFFVLTRDKAAALGLGRWCRPVITDAREILKAGGVIRDGQDRKLLLDVPADVDRASFPELDEYLRRGEISLHGERPVSEGYICAHRRPWWHLGRQ